MRLAPSSLRGRLAGLFALGAAVLLVLSALLIYMSVNAELHTAVDDGLRARATDLAADVGAPEGIRIPSEETFAQVLATTGEVIARSPTLAHHGSVLGRRELAAAMRGPVFVDRDLPGLGQYDRLLARPAQTADGRRVVLVVASSLDPVVRAQRRLVLVLGLASPALIGVLAAGAWALTRSALRPVERMTEEAHAISTAAPGRRLPVPTGNDEIARLGQTLNSMLERIEAAFAHERAFVDDASHELRTPLSILRAELELALIEHGHADEVGRAIASALDEADRLARLADDLLVIARADEGRLPLRCEAVDLGATAGAVARRFQAVDGTPVDVRGHASPVWADPARVEQVLTNLLDNARRHARSRIVVAVEDVPGGVELCVADDGPGFSAAMIDRVFDRFTRADRVRGRGDGGAGLGLAIVATIVEAHGGSVQAENGPPLGGAVVRLELPRARRPAPVRGRVADG